jgi:hypothetical protein
MVWSYSLLPDIQENSVSLGAVVQNEFAIARCRGHLAIAYY